MGEEDPYSTIPRKERKLKEQLDEVIKKVQAIKSADGRVEEFREQIDELEIKMLVLVQKIDESLVDDSVVDNITGILKKIIDKLNGKTE